MRQKTGYLAHPTNCPSEALRMGMQVPHELTGFADIWQLMAAIFGVSTLAEAIAEGTFVPEKAFWKDPYMPTEFADWLEKAYRMPIAELGSLPTGFQKNALVTAMRIAMADSFWLWPVLARDGTWHAVARGLVVYEGPTLAEAIANALQARPGAINIVAFPREFAELHFCKPLGAWLAKPNFAKRAKPVYLIEVDR